MSTVQCSGSFSDVTERAGGQGSAGPMGGGLGDTYSLQCMSTVYYVLLSPERKETNHPGPFSRVGQGMDGGVHSPISWAPGESPVHAIERIYTSHS